MDSNVTVGCLLRVIGEWKSGSKGYWRNGDIVTVISILDKTSVRVEGVNTSEIKTGYKETWTWMSNFMEVFQEAFSEKEIDSAASFPTHETLKNFLKI